MLAKQATRFLKDRIAFVAGKPCSHNYPATKNVASDRLLPTPPRIHPEIHRQRRRHRLHLMEPTFRQKQQIPSLQCHAHEGHVAGVGEALVVRRVRVEITAVQPALGRSGPGAQGFAVVRRGEGEGFLAPDLGEQVVGVVAMQRRQGALGADPDARWDEQ